MPPTTKPKAAGAPPPAKAKNKAAGAGKLPAVKPSPTVSKTPRPETSEKKKKQSIGALGIDKSKPLEKINTKPSPKGTTVTAAAGRKKKEEEEEEKETSSPSIKETSVSAGPPKAPSPTVKKPSPPPVKPLRTRPNALSHSSERESKETKKKEETEEEDDEDDEDEDENEEEEDSDEEDSDEEDDDDEDEEDSDDDDDDDDESEEESSSRRKTKKKKDDGPRLTTKVSREGDKNVKQIYITKKTKFEKYVSEVMERFGFEEATDFDMYCVDAAGDHVDIDVSEDFQELLEPYWPRLAAATGDAGKPQTKKPAAKSANSDVLNGNHERSSDTVVRLYVRESFAYRQRTGQSTKAPSFVSNTHMAGSPAPNLLLQHDSPGNISQLFAETNRSRHEASMYNKTVVIEEDVELQWNKMNVIGKGSFGTVYEGITMDGKMMAVKVQEIPEEDSEESKALEEEINLMRTLKHKNIVAYYGCQTKETAEGRRMMEIFLELCHGGSLTKLRQKFVKANEQFSISLVRTYTRQVLEGLAYLHSCNVMHRDIKSDNVLISASGEAKLADFGCSKRIGTTAAVGGGNGAGYQTLVGSPFFMAPEVMSGSDEGYSYPADIWSVGCLVLELLGREPWSIPPTSNVFQIMFHISKSNSMPSGIPKKCPKMLYNFFERVFDRDPAKRASAEELLKHEWFHCPDNQLEEVPLDD